VIAREERNMMTKHKLTKPTDEELASIPLPGDAVRNYTSQDCRSFMDGVVTDIVDNPALSNPPSEPELRVWFTTRVVRGGKPKEISQKLWVRMSDLEVIPKATATATNKPKTKPKTLVVLEYRVHKIGQPIAQAMTAYPRLTEPEAIRAVGKDVQATLDAASAVTAKLLADGWRVTPLCFDLDFWHPRVVTQAEAKKRLRKLGISAKLFGICVHEAAA
jgi:hypothetical protein